MTIRYKPVSIRQLPEKLDRKQERLIFRDLEHDMNVVRPAIVLDCSRVLTMDRPTIHLLLCCLEKAMKRNGDVRLCGLAPEARLNLERAGVDRLFRIFSTRDEAAESFQSRSTFSVAHVPTSAGVASSVDSSVGSSVAAAGHAA